MVVVVRLKMHPNDGATKAEATHVPVVTKEPGTTVDSALTFLHEANITTISAEDEKILLRKIDWMIMPLMSAVYLMQFIDKNLINFANIMGLGKDTNTSPTQFSHLALSFWVSYLAFEPISGYLLQKLPVAKYLGINVVLWGNDTDDLYVVQEKSSRLSDQEKIIAIERLRGDTTGVENKNIKPAHIFEAIRDPHTWLICAITTAINIPNAAVSTFQAAIIKSLGYTSKEAALLTIPSGVIAIIAILSACFISFRYNTRGLVIVSLLVPGIIGATLMAFLPTSSKLGRLFGTYLTNTIPSSTPLIYSWVAANVAGHTKKVTMNALLLMAFCLGNILGPLTFTAPPNYIAAKIAIIAVLGFAIILIAVLALLYHRENSRRKEVEDFSQSMNDSSFLDLTDRQNKEFRYVL
ncbi:hypothetical protein LTR84_001631 [Exophiala bonariae]|uniref:Major facilitator superfamily (MFS) profile domain-containing protein n=1 Tax=Exophiala bonariae TaxID=1690606 RepID=A0AAV9NGK4_9EURO|nr:hypothetical protein LTR84_001631 [Exophiala bonariae]